MLFRSLKGLDLIVRVPDELWMEVCDIVQETGIKTIPMEMPLQRLAVSKRKLAHLMKSRYNKDTCCWFFKDLGGSIYLCMRFLSLFYTLKASV